MFSSVQSNKKQLEEMLESACHFGHKVSKWNPKMRKYLYTAREGIHIFDLAKTHECLEKALSFLRDSVAAGKTILLVSTKLQAAKLIAQAAEVTGCSFVARKWMPGLLTNYETIRRRIKYFKDLKMQKTSGEWDKYTKKERLELQRDIDKLQDAFGGVESMAKLPDVIVVLDAVHDALALREAKRLGISSIAVCDSNSDPDIVSYPIPGNDDAIKSLKYFAEKITQAIEEGKRLREKAAPKPPEAASLPTNVPPPQAGV